jgi:6-phosphogluconolactonase
MLLLTGSYTESFSPAINARGKGLTLYHFSENSGELGLIQHIPIRNPSFPIWDKRRDCVVVVEEIMASDNPCLDFYSFQENQTYARVKRINVPVSFACHLASVGNVIVLANYLSSDIGILNVVDDGEYDFFIINHTGHGKHPIRQDAPHPHMIYPISANSFFVVDLGIDSLVFYQQDRNSHKWEKIESMGVQLPPGSGPRHMISFKNNTYLVVLGELMGDVFLLKWVHNSYVIIDAIRLIKQENASAAAIVIDTLERFIYISDRATNCIYCLEIINDRICLKDQISCYGLTPRAISIDPSGNWLLSANQDSDSIVVFKRNLDTGLLKFGNAFQSLTPNSFCWVGNSPP